MRPFSYIATAALILPLASAFKNTSPLLIWSSSPNPAIKDASEAITSGVINAEEVYGTISSLGCEWETMAVVRVDELHQSHLPGLTLPSQSADLHIPYLVRPDKGAFENAIGEWAQVCGAEVVTSLREGQGRRIVMLESGKDILSTLSTLPNPDLILLHGSPSPSPPTQIKRQESPLPPRPTRPTSPSQTITPSNGTNTNTTGPLLDRVQLLTTPLITGLLITLVIFVPVVAFGVYALVGIQVPPRMMEISKGMVVGREKKDQ